MQLQKLVLLVSLFRNATEIAAAGKSFTEGEFVKKCLLIAASELSRQERCS
jgi:hypothetical protein